MCAIASSRSSARSFPSFTSAMLTTLRTSARCCASRRGRAAALFLAFSRRSSRIRSRNSARSSAPDRSTSCFVKRARTSSSEVSRRGSFWNARTISSRSSPPLPSSSNRAKVTSHISSNSDSETSMIRDVVCSSRNCRIIVSNSSMSRPPESSASNSANFAFTCSSVALSGSVWNASRISGSSRAPLLSSSKRLNAATTSFTKSSSSTSSTDVNPRPIFFAKLESMNLALDAMTSSTAGPPVSRQHTLSSHEKGIFLFTGLMNGALNLRPACASPRDAWSSSRYPMRISPYSWHRHAISKKLRRSPGRQYRLAGTHAMEEPRGVRSSSSRPFTERSSHIIARILLTMSLDCRKSLTARISAFDWIVCCVRGSKISVTIGMRPPCLSFLPVASSRLSILRKLGDRAIFSRFAFWMFRISNSVARHFESLCMMSPSSSSSAKTITEVNRSMPSSSRWRRIAVFPTWCTSLMFCNVSTSSPPSARSRSRSLSATEAMM